MLKTTRFNSPFIVERGARGVIDKERKKGCKG